MSDIIFRQLQSLQLNHLLKDAAGDPILEPQLRQRAEEANRELEKARKQGDSLVPLEHINIAPPVGGSSANSSASNTVSAAEAGW